MSRPPLLTMMCPSCCDEGLHRMTGNVRTCVWCGTEQTIEPGEDPEPIVVLPSYKISEIELNFSDTEDEELLAEEVEHG